MPTPIATRKRLNSDVEQPVGGSSRAGAARLYAAARGERHDRERGEHAERRQDGAASTLHRG